MATACDIRGFLPAALVAGLLLAAQLGAAIHVYGHDYGAPQAKVCKACIGFDQLASGSVDCSGDGRLEMQRSQPARSGILPAHSAHAPVVRQRGPPGARSEA